MRNIVNLSNEERWELFRGTSAKMGLNDAIIEKDYWVCLTLDYLFHTSPLKDVITFKGGTSLSKGFNLINRFSEDIDLILDWRVLGYSKNEPWEYRSKNKQDKFNKEANLRAEQFLREEFLPTFKVEMSELIGSEANVYIKDDDAQTIVFAYPNIFNNASTLQVIYLEIGALAAWTPARMAEIAPYAAECYPQVFGKKSTSVLTAAPERTFWEKATILHHEANRPQNLSMPPRYSRHYYDLFRISTTKVKEDALNDFSLLDRVVKFKMKFYPRPWAKYEEAKAGSLKLVPPEYRLPELKSDYKAMQEMLYGEIPNFETVIQAVVELEREINR